MPTLGPVMVIGGPSAACWLIHGFMRLRPKGLCDRRLPAGWTMAGALPDPRPPGKARDGTTGPGRGPAAPPPPRCPTHASLPLRPRGLCARRLPAA